GRHRDRRPLPRVAGEQLRHRQAPRGRRRDRVPEPRPEPARSVMRIGVVFPQTELGGDVGAVRGYGERGRELGFRPVLAHGHVVGAAPDVPPPWGGPYNVTTTFHEPFVLFGYLAAITSMELVTGIIILPQRQTVLAAKQAAEVDLLTGGKFR